MKIFLLFFVFLFALSFLGESEGSRRVILLGFDGVDPGLLETFMARGELPHLARLREKGDYLTLATAIPPQSPVSWASFATGMNPGKTRIFDFLTRIPGSYYPDFAMLGQGKILLLPHRFFRFLVALLIGLVVFKIGDMLLRRAPHRLLLSIGGGFLSFSVLCLFFRWIPTEIPKPFLRRGGATFWLHASRHHIPSVLIRVPVTFPPETLPGGRLLSGLGVPDVRKSFGTFSFYTTEEVETKDTEMGGKVIPVRLEGNEIRTFIWGPKNFTKKGSPDIQTELRLVPDPENRVVTIDIQGETLRLREGEWSPWVGFRFDLNPLLRLHGIGRFYLMESAPFLKLYLSPIHFHPAKVPPNFSLSYPRRFSKEIAQRVGLYKTLGWMQETWGLNEGRLSEEAFLEDLFATEEALKTIMFQELAKPDWRLFVGVFEGTDRIQHMFWRTLDPGHPGHDAAEAARFGDVILQSYRQMDVIVGEVLERFVDEETVFLVLSDHGFKSFRRSVNLNTWLVREGYMTLKGTDRVRERNLEDLFGQGEFWPNVDWSRTKAYALGLAGIYINRKGREPQGIVSEDYEAVRTRLLEDLSALQDPQTGALPLVKVYRREEIYSGPYLEETPDLVLGFGDGYRVSWQTALGGIPREVFEDNLKRWSGDHCSYDPSVTAGILFSNRKVSRRDLHIMDIAPTVLTLFGVPVPSEMDGKSFW